MSATIIAVKPGGWGGQAQSKDWIRRYSLVYTIRTDDPGDGPMIVGDCPGLPRRGAYYQFGNERDVGAILKTRTPTQLNNQKQWWQVADSYDSQQDDEDPEDPQENPLLRPPKRRISFEREDKYVPRDKDDKPYVNSAGEPYARETVMTPNSLMVLTITRNEAALPIAVGEEWQDAVNENAFYGRPRDAWWLADLGAEDGWENGVYFWATFYKLVYKKDLWIPSEELDRGTYYWEAGTFDIAKKRAPVDGTGLASTSEIHLNGLGDKLPAADIDAGNFKYREFRKYDRKDFNALNLEW